MADVIRFPVERRHAKIAADARAAAAAAETADGERVEYVTGAYWFGVRIRPEPLTPA